MYRCMNVMIPSRMPFPPVFTKSCDITQFYVFFPSQKLPFFFSIYHVASSASLFPPWLGLLLPSILALGLHRYNYLLWSYYSFCFIVTTTERKQCIVKHVDTKPISWIKNVTQIVSPASVVFINFLISQLGIIY